MFTPEWITATAGLLIVAGGLVTMFLRLEHRLTRIETLLNTLPCQDYRKKIQEDQIVSCPGVKVLEQATERANQPATRPAD